MHFRLFGGPPRRPGTTATGVTILGLACGCLGSQDYAQIQTQGVQAAQTSAGQADDVPAQEVENVPALVANGNVSVPAGLVSDDQNVSTEGDGNFIIGPGYKAAPEMAFDGSVPRGKVHALTMDSTKSAFYTGQDPTLNKKGTFGRQLWIYIPAQYQDNSESPFIIVQDGLYYYQNMPPMLDNLIAKKALPAMLAIFINPGPGDGRGSERGLEYDTVSDKYASFVEAEVLPRLEADFPIKFTSDPAGRATMGGSSGGAAAFTMAWFRPDLYHRVLTYSGTFVNQHPDATYPHGAWAYHEYLIAAAPTKPLRIFLEAGEHDNNQDAQAGDGMHNWVTANDRMSVALAAKGYHYRYLYAKGAGHVDGGVVNQTLPETLMWLWRGYSPP